MQQLTPEEARAVLDLHHLRDRMRDEDGGYVGFLELREVLAVTPDELEELVGHVRSILPARLAVSEERLNQQEAELVVAYHARLHHDEESTIDTAPYAEFVEVARARRQELTLLEARRTGGPRHEEFEEKVGENPFSWGIMWTILAILAVGAIIALLFFTR